jgi:hypothetical protein
VPTEEEAGRVSIQIRRRSYELDRCGRILRCGLALAFPPKRLAIHIRNILL